MTDNTYYFTVTLSGRGETPDEAWRDAVEAFANDFGATPDEFEVGATREYVKEMAEACGSTEEELLACWVDKTPHFDGTAGHRYDDDDDTYCYYCGRPQYWNGEVLD